MPKIIIFYGPKVEFLKILSSRSYNTLTETVREQDQKRNVVTVKNESDEYAPRLEKKHIDTLVAFSDEYSSINEHVILNFLEYINSFDIDNLLLQNPPDRIKKEFEKINIGELEIKYFDYPILTINKLEEIENSFENNILGQNTVKQRLLISLFPLTTDKYTNPIVILFYGPTGVGKTETSKYLGKIMGGNVLRKQFSMFQHDEVSSYLFGGKNNQSSFARDLLERETNVILFDEFDKANPYFYSAFYQMFDEGIFKDENYEVNLTNTIILCTSNFRSISDIKNRLGEPIYSRINSTIEFFPFNKESIDKIIRQNINLQIQDLDSEYMEIIKSEEIFEELSKSYSGLTNARNIKNNIRDLISIKILKQKKILK